MHTKRESTKTLLRLLGLSLLIHGSGLLAYYTLMHSPLKPTSTKPQIVQVKLSQPDPQVKKEIAPPLEIIEKDQQTPEPEELHMPTHDADEFASNNQENKELNELKSGGGEAADIEQSSESAIGDSGDNSNSPKSQVDHEETVNESDLDQVADTESVKEVITTTADAKYGASDIFGAPINGGPLSEGGTDKFEIEEQPEPIELLIPRELYPSLGNIQLLSDQELSDTVVEDPYSEKKSRELQLVNRYLERMTAQVYSFWINPYQGGRKLSGVIKLELNVAGFLESAYIFRSSGDRLLDISVLDAIRAVPRYEVPDNPVIVERYYTNLSFIYSSKKDETEIMPFEEGYADTRKTN